ncbi:hypothetical protein [Planctomicrobium sp. SH664]|uniref:hypothetical protein n=1 Tax=Planctomicrobium sp. SH664 TaxID=3448125 RepID=UPI003F5C710E
MQAEEINEVPTSFYGGALPPQDRMQCSGADKIKIATGWEEREKRWNHEAKSKRSQELHEEANRQSSGLQRSNSPMKSSNDVLFSRLGRNILYGNGL